MRPYYRAVGTRAAKDALGFTRRKGVDAGTVLTVLAIFVAAVLTRVAIEVSTIFAAVLALAGFVVLALLVNLIRAPVLLANDAVKIADNDRRVLEAEIADTQGDVTRLRAELDRITTSPVSHGHSRALRDFAASARRAFDDPHPAFMRLPSDADSLLLSSVSAHFPTLAAVIDTYLNAQECLQDAEQALMNRIQRECGRRDIRDPPFELDQVYASLCPGLHSLAKGWRSDPAASFEWTRVWSPDHPGGDAGWVMLLRGQSHDPLASMAAASADDAASLTAALTSRVEALFSDAQEWDEFAAIRDAYHVLMALLPASRSTARLAAEREKIRMTPDCPICADQIGQE